MSFVHKFQKVQTVKTVYYSLEYTPVLRNGIYSATPRIKKKFSSIVTAKKNLMNVLSKYESFKYNPKIYRVTANNLG